MNEQLKQLYIELEMDEQPPRIPIGDVNDCDSDHDRDGVEHMLEYDYDSFLMCHKKDNNASTTPRCWKCLKGKLSLYLLLLLEKQYETEMADGQG